MATIYFKNKKLIVKNEDAAYFYKNGGTNVPADPKTFVSANDLRKVYFKTKEKTIETLGDDSGMDEFRKISGSFNKDFSLEKPTGNDVDAVMAMTDKKEIIAFISEKFGVTITNNAGLEAIQSRALKIIEGA